MGSSGLMAIDLGCRGAVVGLSLLIAGVLLRDRGGSTTSRLRAALAVSAAATAICSAPGFPWPWRYWSLFLLALSCGGPVIFWLWARATFDDDFVLRRWHGAFLAAIVGLQLFAAGWYATWPALGRMFDRTLPFIYLGLAFLGAAQTLATWRADLVARRLRLRPVVLLGASIPYRRGRGPEPGRDPLLPGSRFSAPGSSVWSVANVFGLWVLSLARGAFSRPPERSGIRPMVVMSGDISAMRRRKGRPCHRSGIAAPATAADDRRARLPARGTDHRLAVRRAWCSRIPAAAAHQ